MWLKWIFDRVVALIGLIVLSPVLLIIAIQIKRKMADGPIIYKQQRVGQYGKLFTMYKFRTMKKNSSTSTITVKGESRITPLGAKLRKYKLDELLELWNVLIGDMSFVGPRPDVPGYADALTGDEREILKLKPGITGAASLKYKNEEELLAMQANPQQYNDTVIFPDKVRINLAYLRHWTFFYDIKLIIKTIFGGEYSEIK